MKALRQEARRQLEQFLSALFLPDELIELRFIESWISRGKKAQPRGASRRVAAARRVRRAARGDHRVRPTRTGQRLLRRLPAPEAGRFARRPASAPFAASGATSTMSRPKRPSTGGTQREFRTPSIVVSSGSGIHGYWLLDRDLRRAKSDFS